MQTVNDYNMEWEINDSEGVRSGKGVFNGDIGYITRIDRTENLAEILFDDGRRAVYTSADMPDLTPRLRGYRAQKSGERVRRAGRGGDKRTAHDFKPQSALYGGHARQKKPWFWYAAKGCWE